MSVLNKVTTFCVFCVIFAHGYEDFFQENRRLSKAIVEAFQDTHFDKELLFDLKKENQVYLNRTMSLLIKYIVKREVDNYRSRRTDAISRRVYSSLIMKLIDIAKDLPRNSSAASRIDTAHRYYMSVETRDMHDQMADVQVFHACARLYDVMFTAPRIIADLGNLDDLTPRLLVKKLKDMEIKPVHLGVALLIQYHLRNTASFVIRAKALEVLATKPEMVGPQVIDMLKALASRLLPVAELLDIHLAHSSPAFKDTCPSTWLGIVNNKQP
ncbi:jg9568 [Pararge aegeria aegeria]|uniref:Jg9568 protein n=1 Tax=Pararge aegeria aegeria TaxID=348720 RepID=A0A8S4QLZ0_9NEOP|nr:jg9568 [Pararge aegeria aegeria]